MIPAEEGEKMIIVLIMIIVFNYFLTSFIRHI